MNLKDMTSTNRIALWGVIVAGLAILAAIAIFLLQSREHKHDNRAHTLEGLRTYCTAFWLIPTKEAFKSGPGKGAKTPEAAQTIVDADLDSFRAQCALYLNEEPKLNGAFNGFYNLATHIADQMNTADVYTSTQKLVRDAARNLISEIDNPP